MTRAVRDESGIMLVELLLAALLMLIVLGATFTSLTTFESNSRINELQNDNQEEVRAAVDQLSREIRNHAVATQQAPVGIVSLTGYDILGITRVGTNTLRPSPGLRAELSPDRFSAT